MTLFLRPMTEAELRDWVGPALEAYVAERIASGEPEADARRSAASEHEELFPDGRPAPGNQVYVVQDDGERVGVVWTGPHPRRPDDRTVAWIYDIEIVPAARGRGLGRATLAAIEAQLAATGVTRVEFHVFGGNTVARRLYVSAGYHETSVQMAKDLSA